MTGVKPAMGRQRGLAVGYGWGNLLGIGVCAEQAHHFACSGPQTDAHAHYFLLSKCSAGASVQNSVETRGLQAEDHCRGPPREPEASASVHIGQV